MQDLAENARQLRKTIFQVICRGGGGHIPACLSIADILTVLYHEILKIDPARPDDPDRDRFILSKGHAGVALYAILTEMGFISEEQLFTYGHEGTLLGGHPDMHKIPGVEASTGALGHGLGFGLGMALAGKMDQKSYRVFVLLGDGECQEGSIWEAAMFASQHKLDNLTAIVDYNKYQALDKLDNIVGLEPLADKWRSFGWEVRSVDGHDISALRDALESVPWSEGKPGLALAHTIKGKGISYMENAALWHYRLPNAEEMKIACTELNIDDLCGIQT
jgi:transketolase